MTPETLAWDSAGYHRFADLRLRPARDLLARIPPDLPQGDIVNLGCGGGAVAPSLAAAFPGRRLIGVDASPAMLERAHASGCYARIETADIAAWRPPSPPALIFSNAALHWLGDHSRLIPALAAQLAPGGVLAVQMPRQTAAPSHRLLAEIATGMGLRPAAGAAPPAEVGAAADYLRLLAPLGAIDAWESRYVQLLDPVEIGHPVRHFTAATAMRPYIADLPPDRLDCFVAAYDAALATAYPPLADGRVPFPFLRVFFVLTRRAAATG